MSRQQARPKPRLRGSVHLRLGPILSLGLNLSDILDIAGDGLGAVRNAFASTPLAERIRRKAAEKRRVRVAEDVVDAEYELTADATVLEETESALVAMGFKRPEAKNAVDKIREEPHSDAKSAVAAALRKMR